MGRVVVVGAGWLGEHRCVVVLWRVSQRSLVRVTVVVTNMISSCCADSLIPYSTASSIASHCRLSPIHVPAGE